MALFRADKLQATYNGNLESVRHNAEMKNGMLVHLGALEGGQLGREVRTVVVPDGTSIKTEEIIVVYTPEVLYDERLTMKDFVIEADKVARGYHLAKGDIFTVDADLVTGTVAEGSILVPSGLNYAVSADDNVTEGSLTVFEVIEATTLGFDERPAYAVQVKSC